MTYNFEGEVKIILPLQEYSSGFKKREIVVTDKSDSYPQDIKFEFINDSISILDNFNIGDSVNVLFGLKGNEYKDKYYTNLVGITIAHVGKDGEVKTPSIKSVITNLEEEDDDLPF